MATPVIISLRSEGLSTVLDALRSVKQAQIAVEEASISAARSSALKRLEILKNELAAGAAMRIQAQRSTDDMLRRALGTGGPSSRDATVGSNTGRDGFGSVIRDLKDQTTWLGGAFGLLKGGIDLATAGLKQFASFLISDVVKPAMALETRAIQIANNSNGKLTAEGIQAKARAIGIRNNIDPMKIVESAGAFQDLTGDPTMGFDIMKTIATLSKARGFDMEDLTKLAGAEYRPGMKTKDLENLLLMQAQQGTTGSVTLGQMAKLGGRIIAPAASLAGNYETGIATTGALLQSGRLGFGTYQRAATGVESFVKDSLKAAKSMPGAIMHDESGVEKIVDPAKLIGQLYSKTSGNIGALKAMGYTPQGAKLVQSYKGQYEGAFDAARAGGKSVAESREAGSKAVEDFIKSFITANTTMESEEAKRNEVLATSGEKWETALATMKESLLDVMPEVNKFVDAFTGHTDEIASAALVLAHVLVWMASVVVDIANGIAKVSGWFGNKTEGDVLKTVFDRGDKTNLPGMQEKGYWRKGDEGMFEYVKGEQAASSGGKWQRVGKGGQLVLMPETQGAEKPDVGASIEPTAGGPRASIDLGLYGPRAEAAYSPGPRAEPGDMAAAGAGHEDADGKAKALAGSLDKLKTTVDSLAMSVDGLNRSEAFSPGP